MTNGIRTAKGWLQPEVQYVYDLCVPSPDGNVADRERYVPKPLDGEVESFDVSICNVYLGEC